MPITVDMDRSQVIAKIGGAHVLLVDDNAINRQVAREVLEDVGLVVDMAADGLEALQKVANFGYHAVLMDIQMPKMDGYQASRHLRSDPNYQDLPIIAMTAHAMVGDRDKCLEAGMNDHVAKPIDKKQLFSALIRWIDPQEIIHQSIPAHAEMTQNDAVVWPEQLPGIDITAAMERLNHNRRLFHALLVEFDQNFANCTHKIRLTLGGKRQNDQELAANLVHTVKGVAGNISADGLFNAALALEKSIKLNKKESWPRLLDHFDDALQQVLASIASLSVTPGSTNTDTDTDRTQQPLDRVKLQPLLLELALLIHNRDFGAAKCLSILKPLLANASVQRPLQQLEEGIDRIDFVTAEAALAEVVCAVEGSYDFVQSPH
ncbi:MAG: response regulator [Magnetococcales bacterium]|nr:response regulator [Magnetococcales bacterium]